MSEIIGDMIIVGLILLTLEKLSEAMLILINFAARFVRGGLT